PAFAVDLNNLATLYKEKGDYAAAEPLYRQALEIRRAALGEDHPAFAITLGHLATLYAATARSAEALSLMRRVAANDDRMVGQAFSFGSESQRAAFLNTVQANLGIYLSLVWQDGGAAPDGVGAALDLVLRRKAIGAESLAAQRDAVLGGRYPHLQPQLR